jgi:hypothetical protein
MAKILVLDISTKTGWALFNEDTMELTDKGLIKLDRTVKDFNKKFGYPIGFLYAAQAEATDIFHLIEKYSPSKIIIEETNPSGRAGRYSQKILEYIHCELLDLIFSRLEDFKEVYYINSSEWRKTLKLILTKEDKKNNKLASNKATKKIFKIRGKITKKHLAVRYVNEKYNLNLLVQDNDIADAICLGEAFLLGAKLCDGQ